MWFELAMLVSRLFQLRVYILHNFVSYVKCSLNSRTQQVPNLNLVSERGTPIDVVGLPIGKSLKTKQ